MMRKTVLSLLAAGAAFAATSPASAQYYPARPAPGYGHGYGYGEVGVLQQRIDNIRRQVARLDRRDVIRGRSADRLLSEANGIERRLHDRARRGGLDPREAGDIQYRLQRLEQRVQFAMNDRYERHGDRW
jgi:hypothetical protein